VKPTGAELPTGIVPIRMGDQEVRFMCFSRT